MAGCVRSSQFALTPFEIGGIVAAVAFQQKDAPGCACARCATIAETGFSDIPGLWTVIAGQIVIIAVSTVLMAWYKVQNRKADEGKCVPTSRSIALTLIRRVLEGHQTVRTALLAAR